MYALSQSALLHMKRLNKTDFLSFMYSLFPKKTFRFLLYFIIVQFLF